MLAEWTPAHDGGANFQTQRLVATDPNRLEFQASGGLRAFFLCFLIAGTTLAIVSFMFMFENGRFSADIDRTILILVGCAFIVAGGYGLVRASTIVVFDKQRGYFWIGRNRADGTLVIKTLQTFSELVRNGNPPCSFLTIPVA